MIGEIIGAALGGLMGGSGGSAQTTVDKSPWGPVQPWLTNNIGYGQQLQGYYQANPFSAAQQSAYGNLLGANNAYRSMMPSLLAQMSNHTGYDMRNPQARSTPFNFTGGNLGFAPVVGNYQAPDVSQYKVAAAPAPVQRPDWQGAGAL